MKEWITFYKNYLIEKVGEKQIFIRYLGLDPTKPGNVTNPLRLDKHPGCNFTTSKSGRIYFHDYAMEKSYDCFSVVMEKYGITFWQAVRLIEKDFRVNLFSPTVQTLDKTSGIKDYRGKKIITYDIQEYTPEDLEYWNKYGISKEILKQYGVQSVANVYINDRLRWTSEGGNPIFALSYGHEAVKFYRPKENDKSRKWLSNTTKENIAFYYSIPYTGDNLVITKSFKDALVLNQLGFPSVAPSSETIRIDTSKFRALKMTYDNIYLLYDNDEVGIKSSERRSKELDIPYMLIPKKYNVKDISDFREKYGEEETIELINKLMKRTK